MVLTAHGCQKLFEWGMAGTAASFAEMGGPELVIVIGCGALMLAAAGAGQWSVDALVARRRAEQPGQPGQPTTAAPLDAA